jgi:hypothetical protein
MAIKCGHCSKFDAPVYHETVAAVRACSELVSVKLTPGTEAVEHIIPAKPGPVTHDGLYVYEGEPVKVVWNQSRTRMYAKMRDEDGRWDIARGLIYKLDASMEMTAEQATAFGKLYGRCVKCYKELTHEVSIYFGYGEKCASNQSWPWYDCPEAHATGESN